MTSEVFAFDASELETSEALAFRLSALVTSEAFAFKANPGTVGEAAVPPKSPANCIFPMVLASASETMPFAT